MSTTAVNVLPPPVSLFYKDEKSDKEYHLSVVGEESTGYWMEYRYGKRGGTLTIAHKPKIRVDFATAKQLYDEKLAEQLAQGYTPNADGTPYQSSENNGEDFGSKPQLLNFITEDQVQNHINDDAWVMQEKKDGVRCMAKKIKKDLIGGNKRGLVISLPQNVVDEIRTVVGVPDANMDGELVGEIYWLFDLLSMGVHAFSSKTLKDRLEAIQEWLGDSFSLHPDSHFRMVPTAVGKSSKKALFKVLKEQRAEGVVFKKLDSVYKPGRPNSGGAWVKFKFFNSATVRVKCINHEQTFQMEMLSKGDWKFVGNCTYYPTIYVPKPGDFVEVQYMYVKGEGGSLYGPPVVLNQRLDVTEDDCLMSQLKYKAGTNDDDGIETAEEA